MGRWKKSKSFQPPALQGFKKKTDSSPVFNFSDQLIDAISYKEERKQDADANVLGGHNNEGFADLDEYGFTLKRRDTSGDIIFRSAEPRSTYPGEASDPLGSFSNLNAFGEIRVDHVVEAYQDPAAEVSEDRETGEKDVVRKSTERRDRKVKGKSGAENNSKTSENQKVKGARNSDRGRMNLESRQLEQNGHAGTLKSNSTARDSNGSFGGKENNNDKMEATSESPAEVTSESKTSLNSRISIDLDDLYKESHLPEKPKPEKKRKKNKKKRNSKAKWDDVVNAEGESPFVRSFRPSGAVTAVVPPSDEKTTDQPELPQVHSNGHVRTGTSNVEDSQETAASTTQELEIEPLPYDPNNVQHEFSQLDEDLLPIEGFPATQIFQSNVPRLSAHRLAILSGPYRSSKYKRGPPVERRIVRNSQKESQKVFKQAWREFEKIVHPTGDIVPAWARKPGQNNTLKYTLIGVLVFVLAAAISIPIIWLYSGSDDDRSDASTTLAPPGHNVTDTFGLFPHTTTSS